MNCESFESLVVDLARSHPSEAGVHAEALAHCSGCDRCSQRLKAEKTLTVELQLLAAEMKSATAPVHLRQNLITALRQQRFAPQAQPVSTRWRYLAVAAAVLIAVALAVTAFRSRQSQPTEFQAVSPAASPMQNVTPEVAPPTGPQPEKVSPVQKKVPHMAKTHRAKRRPTERMSSTFVSVVVGAVTDADAPEVASPYVPLGDPNAANIQEGAQVVRVEMPRYAMARFGLPVNMERYDERVKADVWLGADGVARAIRFVQ